MHISIQNFGPIKSADITLADLTIAVGPQARVSMITHQLTNRLAPCELTIPKFNKSTAEK